MPDDKSPLETTEADETEASEEVVAQTPAQGINPGVVAVAFVGIAVSGVLLMMTLKNSVLEKSAPAEDRFTALQAELEDLSRQRGTYGQAALSGGAASSDDIAARMKSDIDSLVGLAGGTQQILADKDAALAAKNSALADSEKSRIALNAEVSRLREELQRGTGNASDAEMLRADLAALATQRDALSAELAAAKAKLETMGTGVPADDFADLKRRFDETLRAKEFFEARVKELEGRK
jgi:DNA repair exonuclease SbcCD ATPase subunit